MNSKPTLIYAHDPMCSWCFGFKSVMNELTLQLKSTHHIKYILGGLAPDSNTPMPQIMQEQIKSNWQRIEQSIADVKFNYAFWSNCLPKRSTYPACRAVISAKKQFSELKMIHAIQQDYYLNAKNPSDYETLYNLAKQLNLNYSKFISDIHSNETEIELQQQITLCQKIGADSFPSLFLLLNNKYHHIVIDYNNVKTIIEHIRSFK